MALYQELYRLPRRGPGNLAFLHPKKTPNVHRGPQLSEIIREWPSGWQPDTGAQRPKGPVPEQINDAAMHHLAILKNWHAPTLPARLRPKAL